MWNIKSRFSFRACSHTHANMTPGMRCPLCRFEAGFAMTDIHRGLFEAGKAPAVKPEDDETQDLPVGY